MKQEEKDNKTESMRNASMEIITKKDRSKLIAVADSTCDKAIISLWFETGISFYDLIHMQKEDLTKKEDYIIIKVRGNYIPVFDSRKYLIKSMEEDYFNSNGRIPEVFSKLNKDKTKVMPLVRRDLNRLLNRLFLKAKINKRSDPKWFQFSSVSNISSRYCEEIHSHLMEWRIKHDQDEQDYNDIFCMRAVFFPEFKG